MLRVLSIAVLSFVFLALVSGCSTSGRSAFFGAGLGSLAGAGVGALADPGPKGRGRIRNVFIGAAAGSLAGAGAGLLIHEMGENKEKAGYEKAKSENDKKASQYAAASGEPVLIPARVESIFVDDQVRGTTFVPAHFEYRIVEPAKWQR